MTKSIRFQGMSVVIMALAAQACSNAAGAGTQASPTSAPQSPTQAQAASYDPSRPGFVPLRISRGFFESPISGDLKVYQNDASGELLYDRTDEGKYAELPSELPAPEAGAIADFRDQPGQVSFSREPLEVIFTVTPDVSSVDVTTKKVSLKGLEALIEKELSQRLPAGCGVDPSSVLLTGAEKGANSLKLQFSATTRGCGFSKLLTEITLQN